MTREDKPSSPDLYARLYDILDRMLEPYGKTFGRPDKRNALANLAQPFDISRPNEHDSKADFQQEYDHTALQRRDKAVFAFLMLTSPRDGATASLRLCDVDLVEDVVFWDGRYVATKNSKTGESWFLPVDPMYRACLEAWITYLREDLLFGPTDALFPKPARELKEGRFCFETLSRNPYPNGQKINATVKAAFTEAGLHPFHAHSLRKTLTLYGDGLCTTREAFKAWSQNISHENASTTINSYLPVSRERQRDLIRGLHRDV